MGVDFYRTPIGELRRNVSTDFFNLRGKAVISTDANGGSQIWSTRGEYRTVVSLSGFLGSRLRNAKHLTDICGEEAAGIHLQTFKGQEPLFRAELLALPREIWPVVLLDWGYGDNKIMFSVEQDVEGLSKAMQDSRADLEKTGYYFVGRMLQMMV